MKPQTHDRPRPSLRERGAVSIEYLVLGAGLIVLIGVLAMNTTVGDTLACKLTGLYSSSPSGCAAAPIAGPGEDSSDGSSDDTSETDEGTDPGATDPGGDPSTGDGTNDPAPGEGVSGTPDADPPSAPADEDESDEDDAPEETGYQNASDTGEIPDSDAVDDATDDIRDALDGGFWGVRSGDLEDIEDTLDDLTGPELDAVIAQMSDEELEQWVNELEDGWWGSGFDEQDRRDLWNMIAEKASAETMRRLAKFTDEVQPRFDDVGGDDANDGTSPVDDAEYTEVPHELFVDGASPEDITQGQIGDCWLIASLAAIANTNPSIIEDAITANPNGTYTVTLYDDGEPVEIVVTPDLPTVDDNPIFADNGPGQGDVYELWPHLLEKAAAQYYGDYTELEGDWPSKALELLTGSDVDSHTDGPLWFGVDAPSVGSVKDTLEGGGAVLVSTAHDNRNELYENGTLVQGHAYYVYGVTDDGNVLVANPWGLANYPPIELTPEEFESSFIRYDVANPGD